ncbi:MULTISPECIES: hypothetical protein [unclassified Paenibacillus]|uniref:hypothetical protein n=1 Tax=unclassified Paenibacillus TaxID=185978 RepID=UPI0024073A19|nr:MULTISPECIES: hypothetical protein [unclassified Paenibacillus]MDF9845196.1 hypothetical protein [Paenibacillus sp. PastF-2]MDF9850312.1 hypothetical protein [Paenibacillus sp. PastM-2]MDF9856985.1 hypothetical protein [Paenibacillus sp. PastF-1]MDH6482158.1 hypothetical protein [Paenibacillus sp. PastH-2]MDH6509678.1 hypothetical protein [Paenibacillus sp. PastM-3]
MSASKLINAHYEDTVKEGEPVQNEKAMLDGNIVRIMISKNVAEIERMREWAHKRIDMIANSKIAELIPFNEEVTGINENWEKRRCECGRGYSVEQILGDELEEPACPECGNTNSELISEASGV